MRYQKAYVRKRKGVWNATLVYTDKDGKRRQKSKTLKDARNEREAERIADEWRHQENLAAEAADPDGADGSDDALGMTVAQCMEEYLTTLQESKSLERTTLIGYNTHLNYIREHLGDVLLVRLNTARVQRFVNALNKAGYNPSTVRKAYNFLHAGMKWAKSMGYIKASPCVTNDIRLPKKQPSRPNALDEDGRSNLVKILSGLPYSRVVIAAYIALYTGMRQGEIAGLKWSAVNFDDMSIRVCESIAQSNEGGTYSKSPKTNQDRTIPLAAALADILMDWHDERIEAWCEANKVLGSRARNRGFAKAYVVGNADGTHVNPHTISKDWTQFSDLYKLMGTQGKKITFHDLRHTFATATISMGADVRSVSDILGHENVAMTLNIYADADPKAKRNTIDMLNDALAFN